MKPTTSVLVLVSIVPFATAVGCTSPDPVLPGSSTCDAGQECNTQGSSGTAGAAGSNGGTGGTAGQNGTGGMAASAGTSGSGGSSGMGGTSGIGGASGSAGTGGTSGMAGTAGTAGMGGSGGTQSVSCTAPADCLGALEPDCVTATCVSGACHYTYSAQGTVVTDPTTGDCHRPTCDGAGSSVSSVDDTDLPVDSDECNLDQCNSGAPSHPPAPAGMVCSGTSVCDGADSCVECNAPEDCTAMSGECTIATCTGHACGAQNKMDGTVCSSGICYSGQCKPPSCNGLAATCGSSSNDDCCSTATTIPGGEVFYRVCDASGTAPLGAACTLSYPATVSSFRLDKYEVTVGRFRMFLNAYPGWRAAHPVANEGGDPNVVPAGSTAWNPAWTPSLPSTAAEFQNASHLLCNAADQMWTTAAGGNENKPINCVDWYEATAFCLWDRGWLPTEAEWMYAAAGGAENRAYPWSNPGSSLDGDGSDGNFNSGANHVENVGSHTAGKGRWGHEDLGGNVYEWTADWYNTPHTGSSNVTCNDCVQLTPNANNYRVNHGGGWNFFVVSSRPTNRAGNDPMLHDKASGFRCARTP